MATITNKTRLPLNVLLPEGKKLRLAPLKSAEINAKAAEHPAVLKLIEAGKVEVSGSDKKSRGAAAEGGQGPAGSAGARGQAGGMRKTGDR